MSLYPNEKEEVIKLAEKVRDVMETWVDGELPERFNYSLETALLSWFPMLPWHKDGFAYALRFLLRDKKFLEISKKVKTRWNFDLIESIEFRLKLQ